ncbi:chaperone DnaJ-domain protein [Senna tora]|uniref:Chaperone DnaJ-domain protein n=1 Tax=Senna tora TaxID=362788 RepID=A0A834XDJ4_9FABA|nr:chaperone DnaJ-domain protein [Senna tora]
MDNSSSRAEAERWLYTANKLLSARDLHGARSFAVRARESDPTFDASELLLTVIDTLLAGENRINNLHDWYGILQILPYTHSIEYIATHYRRLALLLDPQRNPFAFSSHAFTLVHDAWSVLSNPAKKAMYDNELRLVTGPPPAPPPPPAPAPVQPLNPIPPPNPPPVQHQQHQIPARKSPRSKDGRAVTEEETPSLNIASNEPPRPARPTSEPVRDTEQPPTEVGSSFWTACPYCYVMYEYPKAYEDCTLRCQSCRRGFHAMRVRSPPVEAKDSYYCCWGFFPLGFSGNFKDISGTNSKWNPFSAMFACPLKGGASNRRSNRGPWVYYDDDAAAAFVELSDTSEDDSDDDDWRGGGNRRGKKKAKTAKGKSSVSGGGNARRGGSERGRRGNQSGSGHANLDNGGVVDGGGGGGGSGVANAARAESSKKAAMSSARRRGAGNLGKLDLNVEFSNEVEEPAPPGMREGNVAGNAEENIEGIAFFEGLDEFLSSLPILNVVADDKVFSVCSVIYFFGIVWIFCAVVW